MTIFGLNFLQKTANRDFVKILRFAVSVFLNFYCGSVLVWFGLDTLDVMSSGPTANIGGIQENLHLRHPLTIKREKVPIFKAHIRCNMQILC